MALNKVILKKLSNKTESDPELAAFLLNLFEFESESPGWYIKTYNDILEKTFKETDDDENN